MPGKESRLNVTAAPKSTRSMDVMRRPLTRNQLASEPPGRAYKGLTPEDIPG